MLQASTTSHGGPAASPQATSLARSADSPPPRCTDCSPATASPTQAPLRAQSRGRPCLSRGANPPATASGLWRGSSQPPGRAGLLPPTSERLPGSLQGCRALPRPPPRTKPLPACPRNTRQAAAARTLLGPLLSPNRLPGETLARFLPARRALLPLRAAPRPHPRGTRQASGRRATAALQQAAPHPA